MSSKLEVLKADRYTEQGFLRRFFLLKTIKLIIQLTIPRTINMGPPNRYIFLSINTNDAITFVSEDITINLQRSKYSAL